MNTANPLTIDQSDLEEILSLSQDRENRTDSMGTIRAIISMQDDDAKRDLLALYMLGNAQYRAFNSARKAAENFSIPQITAMLEEKSNLYRPLARGMELHKRQSRSRPKG